MPDLSIEALRTVNRARHQHAADVGGLTVTRPEAQRGPAARGVRTTTTTATPRPRRERPTVAGPGRPTEAERIASVGRALWAELHRWALAFDGDQVAAGRWLTDFDRRVPWLGCSCRDTWRRIVTEMPPDLTDSEHLFVWSIKAHNAVNRELGKPEVGVEEARQIWG